MSKRKRQQGTGCLYQQPGAATWYIQFYSNGVRKRESTGFTSRQSAQDLLNQRLAAASKGEPVQTTKVRIIQLYDHLCTWNKAHSKNTETARWRLHLQQPFGKVVANRLSSSQVLEYRTDRTAAGAAKATVKPGTGHAPAHVPPRASGQSTSGHRLASDPAGQRKGQRAQGVC